MSTGSIIIPAPRTYGAVELKEWIKKHTQRAFIITVALLLLLLLITWLILYFQSMAVSFKKAPVKTTISLSNLPPPPAAEAAPPPPPANMVVTGPAVVAGNPVPVPESIVTPEEFAAVDQMNVATSIPGDGSNVVVETPTISDNVVVAKEAEPDPDEFISVEKEPQFDYNELQKKLKYPDLARKASLESEFIAKVLVGKDGRAKRVLFDPPDVNKYFLEEANRVCMATPFTPAIQNGSPVEVWVQIPIKFKLH
ncbi:MAG: energy transducer TonB [Candidatus Kapabacteria bacterium]|nr:energy transducer TonB [Candidatus Kapabacteria bacterium]MBX7156168.1 energy transducer TonB [Bacteroidota bacterium]